MLDIFRRPTPAPQPEQKAQPSFGGFALMGGLFGGMATTSDVKVTPGGALASGNVALSAAMRVISETIAACDIKVCHRAPDGTVTPVDHPLTRLLRQPNDYLTGFELKEILVNQLMIYGESVWYLDQDRNGRIKGIYPLPPGKAQLYVAPGAGCSMRSVPATCSWTHSSGRRPNLWAPSISPTSGRAVCTL
ncbi:phage portal protein [Paramagnetospirillum kuznetsovii]|nr:phage portal protein [Paramagnetospirillum kuznetsovii]